MKHFLYLVLAFFVCSCHEQPRALIGAYYFDGWSGKNRFSDSLPWAKNAPTHLTARMAVEFSGREPVWGWRDDTQEIMEKQIDLAADNGLGFFAFDWYYNDNDSNIQNNPLHTSQGMYLKAKNKDKLKFCLLVANHPPYEINTTEKWKHSANVWMPLFKDKQYLRVDNKPLVIMFFANQYDKEGVDYLQNLAKENGFEGIAMAACWDDPYDTIYHNITLYNNILGYDYGLEKHTYAELVKNHEIYLDKANDHPYIPCCIAGWDKRPWEDTLKISKTKMSYYFPDRTPEAFGQHLSRTIEWMEKNPDKTTKEKIMVIYAWNELGEGGYLVPTKDDPEGAYLKEIKKAVNK